MIDFLIRSISLRSRIYAGYAILGCSALIITLLAYTTLQRVETEVTDYTSFTDFSVKSVSFTTQLTELQRQSLIYIHEGHRSAGDRVEEIYAEMRDALRIEDSQASPEALLLIKAMRTHLDNYLTTFQEVRKQRDRTQVLVRKVLREHANAIQLLLNELDSNKLSSGEPDSTVHSTILSSFLQIEKYAYRYFDSLDSENVQQARHYISGTEQLLSKTNPLTGNNQLTLQQLQMALNNYQRDFNEAVQRTRGYLFLINVVMAADAYEIQFQAEKLSQHITAQAQNAQDQVLEDISTTLTSLLLICSGILIVISLISVLISRSITQPLQKLTGAFQSITEGDLKTSVPSYPQKDELGELSFAASCLKERSIELTENKQELERSNDELEQFVYTVSHDLKSPIVTSMGFIGIMQKLAGQGKLEQAISKLDRVVKSNTRMSQLVNDLLELSRVGRTDLDKHPIDLNTLLVKFKESQTERLKRAGFTLNIKTDLPTIYANESRILQVFENLLSNALKYAVNDGSTVIEIGSQQSNGNIRVYFSDNGPGIPEEYREKIFGLFYRLDANTEGTGIGLAVSRKVLKNHGGDIWVESTSDSGSGATFWLEFPQQDTSENLPAKQG